jgi:hypothetical protein
MIEKLEGMRPFGRRRFRLEDNIKIDMTNNVEGCTLDSI